MILVKDSFIRSWEIFGIEIIRGLTKEWINAKFLVSKKFENKFGSYFIRQGHIPKYLIPQKTKEAVMAKHGVDYDSDNDSPYWEASWELMDLAQDHWQKSMREVGN